VFVFHSEALLLSEDVNEQCKDRRKYIIKILEWDSVVTEGLFVTAVP
jgi:hypothetical protein